MSAYQTCNRIEAEGEKVFLEAVATRWPHMAAFPVRCHPDAGETEKAAIKSLQLEHGDFLMCQRHGVVQSGPQFVFIDLKVEKRTSRNFFIETYSNFPVNPGWFSKTKAYGIAYVFLEPTPSCYLFRLDAMRRYVSNHRPKFNEVQQSKYEQANDTRGILVPIQECQEEFERRGWHFERIL